jgi:hypothetical protein
MAIRLTYGNVTIEVDKFEEAVKMAKSLGVSGAGQNGASLPSERLLDIPNFKQFRDSLKRKQKLLVKAMLSGADVVTDADLQGKLDTDDNKAIGGIMAGISRRAKKYGFNIEAMWTSSVKHGEDGRVREFAINPHFKKVAADAGGVK